LNKIDVDTERDNFMDAETAREYGLVDAVLDKRQANNKAKA
jgi:ATP-dependent Clp protease, protease subunit